MTNAYPHLVALSDEDSEDRTREAFLEKFWADYQTSREYLDDQISGFWKTKPVERLAWYEQHEPVFIVPDLVLALWLMTGNEVEMAPVYWQAQPEAAAMQAQVAEQAMATGMDPMTIPPPIPEVYLGMAPAVLAPYWARNWAWNATKGKKLLRDYAQLQKERETREAKKLEAAIDEMPEMPEVAY